MIANLEIMMNSTVENSTLRIESSEFVDFFCFADEIHTHIDRIDGQIEAYLKDMACVPNTQELLRSMHSIKGTAGFWNAPALQEAAHRAETGLVAMANGNRVWSEATASMVGTACQELRHLLQLPLEDAVPQTEPTETAKPSPFKGLTSAAHWHASIQGMEGTDDLDGVKSLFEMMTDCVQMGEIRVLGEDHQSWTLWSTLQPDELVAIFKMHVSQTTQVVIEPMSALMGAPTSASAHGRVLESAKGLAKTLRVQVDSLTALQDIAGRLTQLQEPSCISQAAALAVELQEGLNSIRLVTVAQALARYEPMVQTLAQRLNKKIEWHLNGGTTLVDRRLMARVNEPLMHLVRNSCDHGIETVSVRLAHGKLPGGKIGLDVFRSEAGLHFHLTDDGAGLSRQALVARARLKGLAVPTDSVADADIWALIFEPGFSTASEVTDISGRGVGLDVVRQTILDLGGSVQLQSKEGGGLSFEITVPEPSGW
jgi:chemotaxis protein histidine kinase CheA